MDRSGGTLDGSWVLLVAYLRLLCCACARNTLAICVTINDADASALPLSAWPATIMLSTCTCCQVAPSQQQHGEGFYGYAPGQSVVIPVPSGQRLHQVDLSVAQPRIVEPRQLCIDGLCDVARREETGASSGVCGQRAHQLQDVATHGPVISGQAPPEQDAVGTHVPYNHAEAAWSSGWTGI